MKLTIGAGHPRAWERPPRRQEQPEASDDRGEVGRLGEQIAAEWLDARGFELIGRNLRRQSGELDIVALEGERLVFVEVRTRRRGASIRPEETVREGKRRRVAHQARCWLSEHPGLGEGRVVCFDVVGVSLPSREVRHYRCAFEAEGWW